MTFDRKLLELCKGYGVHNRKNIGWCTYEGRPSSSTIQNPLSLISEVKLGTLKASADDVAFRDPSFFVAGEIHHHFEFWEKILQDFHKRDEVLRYILQDVSVHDFFKHFKGQFNRKEYDSPLPPKMFFENNKICSEHEDFISATILERIANGSMSIWGKVADCEPPHLVMPLTIEPSKPRMCHDERFLNLWMDTPHVSLIKSRISLVTWRPSTISPNWMIKVATTTYC